MRPTALTNLMGLKLTISDYAADMRGFGFAELDAEGIARDAMWWLKIQGAWRIEYRAKILTGSFDWHEPADSELDCPPEWDPAHGGSLQEERLRDLFQDHNKSDRVIYNRTASLVVEDVDLSGEGDVLLKLTDGVQLRVFVAGSRGEFWRIFEKGNLDSHFVFEL